MAILKLLATGAPVEQIAEVVSWRLSEIRNRVFGTVDTVEVFYIVDPAGALPSTQLEERLRTFESSAHFDIKRARYELVLYSVQRAVLIYGGYWNSEIIRFVDYDTMTPPNSLAVNYREEISIIMKNLAAIEKERGVLEGRRRELSETLNRTIAPEFDRIDLRLARMEGNLAENTEIVGRVEGNLSENTEIIRKIAEKMGV